MDRQTIQIEETTPRVETPMFPDQPPLVTPSPTQDYSLLKFSFEHRILGDGITPDARTKMTPKSAAEDNYQLTRCQFVNAYSIKWSGRYLTVVPTDGTLEWNIRKEEPSACWEIVPGFCGGDGAQYVMLKSKLNNNYLRVNASTKKLVCVDKPSTENAAQYCWKFQKDDPIRRRCGTFYHPDYQRVVWEHGCFDTWCSFFDLNRLSIHSTLPWYRVYRFFRSLHDIDGDTYTHERHYQTRT
jgi:hypothetical protein